MGMATNQALSNREAFNKKLYFGQLAETEIARWIRKRNGVILPIYDIEYDHGKGPRIFYSEEDGTDRSLVAPDLLIYKDGKLTWIEAKHKSVFTWYRTKKQWETGIDLHHYRDYLRVEQVFSIEIWLLFLHEQTRPSHLDIIHDGCPQFCPVGLFGNSLKVLKDCESHRSSRDGRTGMVYWAHRDLKKIASLKQIKLYASSRVTP